MRSPPSTLLAMLTLCGCAGVQLGGERLDRSEATIQSATALGADRLPDASAHLQLAREQTAEARALAAAGDDRAPRVLARAQADADLAVALAQEPSVRAQAVRAQQDLESVRARPAP